MSTFRIHNIRLGFATNSSSTHSLIFVKNAAQYDSQPEGSFGWDHFTASKPDSKRDYLAQTLYSSLLAVTHTDIAAAVVERWVGDTKTWGDRADGHIDHQSMLALPRTFDGKGVHKGFFDEFKTFMLRDDVAILGGDDNSPGEYHPLLDERGVEKFELPLPRDEPHADIVARKDELYDYWTVFNRDNGSKVRMSFSCFSTDNVEGRVEEVKKATQPELVDIKITDFCTSNCAYCYQGSTPEGKHASVEFLSSIASALQQMEVFEVAIGGGEPTDHPDFVRILKMFRDRGVVPNFTTRSTEWLEGPSAAEVFSLVGGAAFSVSSAKEIDRVWAVDAIRTLDPDKSPKVNVQYVMGSTPLEQLKGVVRAAAATGLQLVLLGYKTSGRGANFKPYPYDGWYDVIAEAAGKHCMLIGIDTALATEVEQDPALKSRIFRSHMRDAEHDEVDPPSLKSNIFYTVREGAFSMYIDAVELKMGPSSYCESLLMRPLPGQWKRDYESQDPKAKKFEVAWNLADEIKTAFARW